MELFIATLQVVAMMFIALFLNQRERARGDARRDTPTLRFFHYAVATLGLLAFSCSVFVIGAEIEPPRWAGILVTVALAFSMAALAAQAFARGGWSSGARVGLRLRGTHPSTVTSGR